MHCMYFVVATMMQNTGALRVQLKKSWHRVRKRSAPSLENIGTSRWPSVSSWEAAKSGTNAAGWRDGKHFFRAFKNKQPINSRRERCEPVCFCGFCELHIYIYIFNTIYIYIQQILFVVGPVKDENGLRQKPVTWTSTCFGKSYIRFV